MSIMSSVKLSAQIRSIKGNSTKLRLQIQEALISCAYYAAKDGQVTPFNQLLDAVGSSTRIKGLTAWAELYGFVQVKNERFVLNKSARKEANVTCEEDFEPFLQLMIHSPMWFDIVPAEKPASIFDASHYLSGVIAKLEKEGIADIVPYIENAIAEYNKVQAIKKLEMEALGEAPL